MSFSGMSRSIHPMWWRRFAAGGGPSSGFAPGLFVLMSLRPAIPRRVGLHQTTLPLHRPVSMLHLPAGTVSQATFQGWGIFDRLNGEISTEVDIRDVVPTALYRLSELCLSSSANSLDLMFLSLVNAKLWRA